MSKNSICLNSINTLRDGVDLSDSSEFYTHNRVLLFGKTAITKNNRCDVIQSNEFTELVPTISFSLLLLDVVVAQ